MEENQIWTLVEPDPTELGKRLDRILSSHFPSISRSQIQKAVEEGAVLVNQKKVKPSFHPDEMDRIKIQLSFFEKKPLQAEALPLDILYEDEDLLIINKQAGQVVHPTDQVRSNTLVNALLYRQQKEGMPLSKGTEADRPGIVHRLDAQTSGGLIICKTDLAQEVMGRAFRDRQVQKLYLALVEGAWPEDLVVMDQPIGRNPKNPQKRCVIDGGKEAISRVICLSRGEKASLVKVNILTGRTHQIRVHLADAHHPVIGDGLYGFRKQRFQTTHQLLHSWGLSFAHPRSGQPMIFFAPLDPEFQALLSKLGIQEPKEDPDAFLF